MHPLDCIFVLVGKTLLQTSPRCCSSLALTSLLCFSHLSRPLLGSASLICSFFFSFFASAAGFFFLPSLVYPQNIFRLSGSDTCWYTGRSHTAQVLCQHPKGERSWVYVSMFCFVLCRWSCGSGHWRVLD